MSRVLVLSREFPPGPGGIGTHAWQVCCGLHRAGWEVSVLSPQDYASAADIAAFNAAQAFPVETLPSGRSAIVEALHRRRRLVQAIRKARPDIVLASGQRSVWLAAAVCGRSLPWVAVAHGSEFGGGAVGRALGVRAFGRANAIICVSQFTRRVVEEAGVHARRCAVIPNGADASRFRILPDADVCAFREQYDLGSARVLLTVGQVSERKGQDVVIRAMPALLQQVPDAVYVIAGMPTRQAELMELASRLGVSNRVRFVGRLEESDLLRCMNSADVFVMTSRRTADGAREGFGIAVVEAALCGKPAVVSNESGLAEAILDGETGIGVPEDDPATTAAALSRLLCDGELRARMAGAARSRACQEQTWDIRTREYDALLHDVAGER